ncbi:MAG: Gfo/Idh/MocA family oxidoreductase [bacterium]
MKIAQIGCGYWGRNLFRVFTSMRDVEVAICCDEDPKGREAAKSISPNVETCEDIETVLGRDDIDAVVIATPAGLHHAQAKRVLEAGKHVLVEKPLATSVREAEELVGLAEAKKRILMVGHTFLYNDAVRWIKNYIQQGELGDIYYTYFHRLNLGRVRQDVDVIWNLAPHDVSICQYWYNETPSRVEAHGISYLQSGIADVGFLNMYFASGRFAHIHVSWLDPHKVRGAVIVGNKKMLVYDDASQDQKVVIYNKGIDKKGGNVESFSFDSYADFQLVLRASDIWIPRVDFREPLQVEARHFVTCVMEGKPPLTDGRNGVEVVRTLEMASDLRGIKPK